MDQTTYSGVTTQYQTSFIIRNIGIDLRTIGRSIDIGCGREARLVQYLRSAGVQAEGIDPGVCPSEHLMQGYAHTIARPDATYDFAYSHIAHFKDGQQINRLLVSAIGGEALFTGQYDAKKKSLLLSIDETLRVLKPQRPFVIWPAPTYLLEESSSLLCGKGIEVKFELIEGQSPAERDALTQQFSRIGTWPIDYLSKVIGDEMGRRAVLTKR